MNDSIIEVDGLGKRYEVTTRHSWRKRTRTVVTALDDVTFSVARGECFGLLGPNGAGKTSLIKCLTTLLIPDSGTVRINGYDVVDQPQQVCASVGCMLMGERGVYWKLTGRENLDYFATLYFQRGPERRAVIARLIERLGLSDFVDRAVETYSSGQRMRIAFARALIHDAPIIVLDEPTNTLDVHGAQELRHLVREMHDSGHTIIYSTHLMSEAEELCDRVAIVDRGRIIRVGRPRELSVLADRHGVLSVAGDLPLPILEAVQRHPGARSVSRELVDGEDLLRIELASGGTDVGPLLRLIEDTGGRVTDLWLDRPRLEEAFLDLTRRPPAER